jgi:hypothetical protein
MIFLLNLVFENILWIMLVFIASLISFKIPQAIIISRKLLKWNRSVMWSGLWEHKADIFISTWYTLYWISSWDLNKNYFSPTSHKNLPRTYRLYVDEFLELKLIECDPHDKRYRVIRNIRNKIILFILKDYLVHRIWDQKSHYIHLKQQLKNHLSKK